MDESSRGKIGWAEAIGNFKIEKGFMQNRKQAVAVNAAEAFGKGTTDDEITILRRILRVEETADQLAFDREGDIGKNFVGNGGQFGL